MKSLSAAGGLILLWNPPSKNPGYAPEKGASEKVPKLEKNQL